MDSGLPLRHAGQRIALRGGVAALRTPKQFRILRDNDYATEQRDAGTQRRSPSR